MPSASVTPPASSIRIGLQFAGAALVWGASFFFMKVALTGTSWGQVSVTRLVFGALALAAIVAATRTRLPRSPRVLAHFLVVGVVGSFVPYTLFAWAEQYVSSGLASIYNACTPLLTVLMVTLAFRVEKLRRRQLLGVLVGVVGVLVLVAPWRDVADGAGVSAVSGQLACIGAAVCYGFTYAYLRRFVAPTGVGPLATAFLQIGVAAAIALLCSPWLASDPVSLTPAIVASLAVLGVAGTGLAYLWNMNVLAAWGPTVASTITYVTPVVGVTLGILVLGEALEVTEPIGAALIFAGILLAQRRSRAARLAVPPAERG